MSLDNYSLYVKEFRNLLLEKYENNNNKKEDIKLYLKRIFHILDENSDGIITTNELRHFISTLNINTNNINTINNTNSTNTTNNTNNNNNNNNNNSSTVNNFIEILIHQIDINGDGKISYSELMEFLWPKEISQREIGIVIQKIRDALLTPLKDRPNSKSKSLLESDDVTLIEAFAKLTGVTLLRGNLIEVRALKKAFSKVNNPILGVLSRYEIDILVSSLDANGDGVVSAREFRKWLSRLEEDVELIPYMNQSPNFVKTNEEIEHLNSKYKEIDPPISPIPELISEISEEQEQEQKQEIEFEEIDGSNSQHQDLNSSSISKYEEVELPISPITPQNVEETKVGISNDTPLQSSSSTSSTTATSTSSFSLPPPPTPIPTPSPAPTPSESIEDVSSKIELLSRNGNELHQVTGISTTRSITTINHSQSPEINIKLSSLNQRKNKLNTSNENHTFESSHHTTESYDQIKTSSSSTPPSSSSSPLITPSNLSSASSQSSSPQSSTSTSSRILFHPSTIRCVAFSLGIIILWFTVYSQDNNQSP